MIVDTSAAVLEQVLAAADAAARGFGATSPATRGALLRDAAAALDAAAGELVPVAGEETSLPVGRLTGELARTTFQLRHTAEVVERGACVDAVIERADPDWTLGPRPDLRRVGEPIGPVLVSTDRSAPQDAGSSQASI